MGIIVYNIKHDDVQIKTSSIISCAAANQELCETSFIRNTVTVRGP